MKRCKNHLSDLSSCVGVCASCLHERLNPLSAAQLQLPPPQIDDDVTRRKVDNAAVSHDSLADQRFHNTPQVRIGSENKRSKWTLLSNLFRSTSWLSSSVAGHRRQQSRLFFVDNSNPALDQTFRGGRGMSPVSEGDCVDGSAGELPEGLKETPKRAAQSSRRGGGRRKLPGMVLCLNPLVRANPNRKWIPPPEIVFTGETRSPVVKPHLANAASSYANRSRKTADFGRFYPSR